MRITSIGHAGLLLETAGGRIVCDPWFNPAYFASWFVFPSQEGIDRELLRHPDYLYISHLHKDHFDPRFLREHVDKDVPVLVPDYPTGELKAALRDLGFTELIETRNGEPVDLGNGLRIMIAAMDTPADGPIGDSALAVDDGHVRILNQNDARPVDDGPLLSFTGGTGFDGHFLQYSGAIWYPLVYDFPDRMKATVGRRKRLNGMARALQYVRRYDARHVFPIAGPACFLDEDLFRYNDMHGDDTNIFPDQTVFLEYLESQGVRGEMFITGTSADLVDGRCELTQPMPPDELAAIFTDKERYLRGYQERMRPVLAAERATWARPVDLLPELQAWFTTLLAQADHIADGIAGRVLLDLTGDHPEQIVIDFLDRRVAAYAGEECRFVFTMDRSLVETCVADHEEDWVNSLFLSLRFSAHRQGPYNEFVYTFFKCLNDERLQYAEGFYAEATGAQELCRADGHLVQRRCPHLKADLVRFGSVSDGVLTCSMHGWQFDLESGRCLTADSRKLHTVPDDGRTDLDRVPDHSPGVPLVAG